MKKLSFLFIFFLLTSCSYDKKTYWCGDHPCINKAEREAYFKRNMSVEVKKYDKKDKVRKSEIEKILKQAKVNEKNRILTEKQIAKKEKLDEKNRIKQEKLDVKNKLKREKLNKKLKAKEEKMDKKRKKKLAKKNKKEIKLAKKNSTIVNKNSEKEIISNFSKIVEKIKRENLFKPYPDINAIPR